MSGRRSTRSSRHGISCRRTRRHDGSGHRRAVAAQFALTALYHFLFVTLTPGLSLLLGVIETLYVMTGHRIWRAYDAVLGV
jgi:hypothetical protein